MAVTPADIAVELGRTAPVSPTLEQWQSWIDRTYRAIQRRAERLGVDYLTIDPDAVDDVVLLAVVAHARRPDDATQVTKAVDDGSVTRTYKSGSGRVVILDEWWADLGLGAASDVYSLQMTGEPDSAPVSECWT